MELSESEVGHTSHNSGYLHLLAILKGELDEEESILCFNDFGQQSDRASFCASYKRKRIMIWYSNAAMIRCKMNISLR